MTIYALSTGPGISGVAVIRVSGPETKIVISKLTNGSFPEPRVATFKKINKINTTSSMGVRSICVSSSSLLLPRLILCFP